MKRFALFAALFLSAPLLAVEVPIGNPITLTVVVDRLDLVEEVDGLAVGSNRVARSYYEFDKPLLISTNGVELVGRVFFRAAVSQETSAIAAADGAGKTYDGLTVARAATVRRREALTKLRPAIIAVKERVAPASP